VSIFVGTLIPPELRGWFTRTVLAVDLPAGGLP